MNSIPSKSSIGEIATILMIRCLIRLNNVRIFSFMSDDKDARGCAYDTEESIFSYNCDSLFILLKQNGVKKDEARQFAKCWKNIHGERTIKYNDKERNKGIDFFNFIDDVYADKFVISRNGLPKIK